MEENEKETKKEALLYYATKDNINKLIASIKMKEGNEESIRASFGKGKYNETKRALLTFNIVNDNMSFTNIGRNIAYGSNEVENLWFDRLMNYMPYENYIRFYLVNRKSENDDTIELADILNFWGRNGYGNSESNRSEATPTFATFMELSGIGEFKIGRHGNPSRILVNYDRLTEKMQNLNKKSENIIQADMKEEAHEIEEKSIEPLQRLSETNKNTASHNNFANTTININIDMSTWAEENVLKALQILKEI